MLKFIRTGILIIISLAIILIFFGNRIIETIIFRPTKIEQSFAFKFSKPFDEFFIETESGININVIKFPVKNPKGSILYFHGNKDNLIRWGEIVSQLSVYEYNIYVFDYRGYGKSSGSPSEGGVLHDSEVIFNKINQKFPDEHWIFYGRSLGTGIAAYLSSKYKPKGLILESPYYSMEELITHYYFPYLWYDQKITIPTHSYLKESSFPILILHGKDDQVVPIEEGQKLFQTLQNPKKRMITIIHGTHDNLAGYYEYQKAMHVFLNE
jgi:alpha-beta hydrolase superfamily lysophospholipase